MIKRPVQSGVLAGFVATVVLSFFMVMKSTAELLPQLSVIAMLNEMMGAPVGSGAGWFVHLAIGTLLWGIAFAIVEPKLPMRSMVGKGLLFGIAAWLLMMVLFMPMAGAGFFGADIGLIAPIVTLLLHLIYGAVLGAMFGWLAHRHPARTADMWPGGREH